MNLCAPWVKIRRKNVATAVLTRGFTRILLLTDSGVTLWDDCDNTIIANNMIKNGTSDGIFVWDANSPTYTSNVTVTGNTVSNKATGWGHLSQIWRGHYNYW
jgi:parallel beta-helix repeat protein